MANLPEFKPQINIPFNFIPAYSAPKTGQKVSPKNGQQYTWYMFTGNINGQDMIFFGSEVLSTYNWQVGQLVSITKLEKGNWSVNGQLLAFPTNIPHPLPPQPASQQVLHTTVYPAPNAPLAPQPAQLHQANQEKERMIAYLAIWKETDHTKPWIERVKETVLVEKMLRSINEGVSKGTEPTTESVKAMQPSPEIQSLYDTAINGVEVPF